MIPTKTQEVAATGNRIVSSSGFDPEQLIHELKHFLPSQTPLKDFIHHNSLHAYQNMKFYDAIFKASKTFGYHVTLQLAEYRALYREGRIREDILENVLKEKVGDTHVQKWKSKLLSREYDENFTPRIGALRGQWKKQYGIDLDTAVQPLLFRILCSYLDQGIAIWKFPYNEKGLLASIKELEQNSFSSFFKTKRAKDLLLSNKGLTELLHILVGEEDYYKQYVFDQQFSHQGWSGIVSAIESMPGSLLDKRVISLEDLITLDLLFEIDALDYFVGKSWKPLASEYSTRPVDLFEPYTLSEFNEVLMFWQDAFEWSYYDQVLAGIAANKTRSVHRAETKTFQALFCIDERECSIRRYVESLDENAETFGTPGFFGVEFFFHPENAKFYDKLCPAPVTPKYLIKEYDVQEARKHDFFYSPDPHTFLKGTLFTLALGFVAGVRIFLNLFRPKMSPAISNAFAHMTKRSKLLIESKDTATVENGLQVGFTVDEMSTRVENLLRGIALTKDFAPLIYVIAHGSSSANNPHHGAHDCGACSGRPGSVNARVFAFMANHPEVRIALKNKGIVIPQESQFIGALHDTAGDEIEFYDTGILNEFNQKLHIENKKTFENALDLNAKERSRRFASIDTKADLKTVREEIRKRSVSLFEPRPELGHGTNTLCIVAPRDLTKKLFLDRRAFLNSYDYRTDPEGKLLQGIMRPLGPVCGGINLEYYFSRVDNYKLGAGTKLPHNVMGLIGVANSSDGDLRPGLPVQMIEVHDPVRLLIIVEHLPEVVLKTIQSAPEMYEWFINEWVQLIAHNPEDGNFYFFKDGKFTLYKILMKQVPVLSDINVLIEEAPEMETNKILDATFENLPVYLIK